MSLEQRVTELVLAANNLTGGVDDKISEIDQRVEQAEQKFDQRVDQAKHEFDQFKAHLQETVPLPFNLFKNSMMRAVEPEGHPTGSSYTGCKIEAVHSYTKGFEGPYTPVAPEKVAATPDLATAELPYWYGRYYMGPRIHRGGLRNGWGGLGDGNILKITSTAANEAKLFRMPLEKLGLFEKVGVKFWIKIVSGSLAVGTDAGIYNGYGSHTYMPNKITKSQTDTGTDGWFLYDRVIGISSVTNMTGNVLNFGLPENENCEIYIALPYAYIPMAPKHMLAGVGETVATPYYTFRNQS
ncbi:hypothetical protein [Vibrio mangrovi]|uniref:Uncharacterized protein n=1 Tax=Vibrio mangrovi TaxID=474394 RepID=A0A1Y6ITM1_9VIBR|nr:hypothetical protein [Vibrio mangrovi]MDW6004714.1 hypothetical protein [Vibrio mangrovi]SMS01005.1 hypothetical protein VIM7927_02282 [Vibrio mangrovi]